MKRADGLFPLDDQCQRRRHNPTDIQHPMVEHRKEAGCVDAY